MNLTLSYQDLEDQLGVKLPSSNQTIHAIAFDTRRIIDGKGILFFALSGKFRNGHGFIGDAYKKGVRTFIVTQKQPQKEYPEAVFIKVEDTLKALQLLAKNHRKQFSIPVIAITGSAGKTIVKEWLGQILDFKFNVVRSPKSYNSQLGVALSLLEISSEYEIAIIEAGISHPGEMEVLADMIQPTHGIFTSLGSAHSENFENRDEQMSEKLKLFDNCVKIFAHHSIPVDPRDQRIVCVHEKAYATFLDKLPFHDEISRHNASLVLAASREFGVEDDVFFQKLPKLDRIPLRLETFDGNNNCIIINDTYNLDLDAFRSSLEYQLSIAKGKNRVVIIGTNEKHDEIKKILNAFEPITPIFIGDAKEELPEFHNSIILVKGKRDLNMEQMASRLRAKKHQTFVEVNLSALRMNLSYFKSQLPENTKVLAMVKAASYGSGIDEIGTFLEHIGIDSLGVAYADEGVQLRHAGVKLPILVMNTEEAGFEDCIQYNLEPCMYSIEQMNTFIKRLIYDGKTDYPVHLKLETGMNRLGFTADKIKELIRTVKSHPEIRIRTVYSHLATSDTLDSPFVLEQVNRFEKLSEMIQEKIPYHFERHLLNSEGILNYSQYHYDMVRVGIGMYGFSNSTEHRAHLKDVIHWYSAVSQVRKINAHETVGYGRAGISQKDTRIAVIPVGYADGFRRSLSKGAGGVFIHDTWCPVLGNVCMDMIMVDIGDLQVSAGDRVEIIGDNQPLMKFAKAVNTIPYEVLTGISKRVHRVYIES